MDFEINLRKAKRSLLILLTSSFLLVALLALTKNVIKAFVLDYPVLTYPVIFIFSGYSIFLLYKLLLVSRRKHLIRVGEEELTFPDYFLDEKRIPINAIYSVEVIVLGGIVRGVILGITGKSRQVVDAGIFKEHGDFNYFVQILSSRVGRCCDMDISHVRDRIAAAQLDKRAFASFLLALLIFIIFLIGNNGDVFIKTPKAFLVLGGNTKELISKMELYRAFSSFFIHTRFLHIAINMIVLGVLAYLLEKTIAQIRFVNVTLVGSLFGVLSSNILMLNEGSVGASGGTYSLFGAYIFLKYKYEEYLPGSINSIPVNRLVLLLLFEFYAEIFWLELVDYINHLGGFISGFMYMFLARVGPRLEFVDQPTLFEKGLFATLVSGYALGLSYFLLLYYGVI